MNCQTHATRYPALAVPAPPAITPAGVVRAWRALAARLAAWAVQRRRAADDLDLLAGMSERELHDLGISRSSLQAIAAGAWTRDRADALDPGRGAID